MAGGRQPARRGGGGLLLGSTRVNFTYSEPNVNFLEIPNGGFVSSIPHCIFNTNLVMASVNDDSKIFLTYLKTVHVKMENLLDQFPLRNGSFYLKTSWRVQRARMLGAVQHQK